MHIKRVLFCLLLFASGSLLAQPVEISVKILQSFAPEASLYRYLPNGQELIDSARLNEAGVYHFKVKENHLRGLYKVLVGKGLSFDMVVGNEPLIDVSTVVYAPEDSLRTNSSIENTVYWNYMKAKKRQGQHKWLLSSLMDFYPEITLFKIHMQYEQRRIEEDFYSYYNHLLQSQPTRWAGMLITLEQYPLSGVIPEDAHELAQMWWGNIDFNNEVIQSSPALKARIWAYLDAVFNDDYDKEEQESHVISAIDALMTMPMEDQSRELLRNILIAGFVNSNYHEVVEFIEIQAFGSLPPLRKKTNPALLLQQPILKVGQKAFDFTVTKPNGEKILLSQLDAQYVLVLFWSTWCPHCIDVLPGLYELYTQFYCKGFEVVAVSVNDDEDDEVWREYIEKMGLNWVNTRESYMNGSEMLYRYRVGETPMMFLLDKDLTVISRPDTRRQLRARLKKLF